jgi:hypothetical protein
LEVEVDWVAIALASAVPIALVGAFVNRCCVTHESEKGNILRGRNIGWQFIRFCVLATGLPIVALLAIKGIVAGEAAIGFIAGAAGYAFGKIDKS